MESPKGDGKYVERRFSKMSKKKVLLVLVAGLALGLVALVVAAMFFLNSIVKKGVETVGPKVASVEMRLDSCNLSLFSGSGELHGLFVGNPEGYKTASAIKVGDLALSLDPSSALSDKIHIRSIRVMAPEITLEGGLKDNNLTKILANVESYTGTSATGKDGKQGGKKLQIDELVVSGGKIFLAPGILAGNGITVTLPEIKLTGLGAGNDGITGAEAAAKVLRSVVGETLTSVAGSLGKMGELAVGTAKDVGQGAMNATKSVGKGAADGLNKAADTVGGLFKKKKP